MTNDKITVSRDLLRQTIDLLDDMLAPGATFSTASLRAALEQPGVEPVAWYDGRKFYATPSAAHMDCADIKALRPLYEAPQAQHPSPTQRTCNHGCNGCDDCTDFDKGDV